MMTKRVVWLAIGAAAGVGLALLGWALLPFYVFVGVLLGAAVGVGVLTVFVIADVRQ